MKNKERLQKAVKEIHIAPSIRDYIIELVNRLRHQPDLRAGPSPRGSIALLMGARARAFTQGRDFVIPDDVKGLLIPALYHRCQVTVEAEMEDISPEAIIKQVATEVPVPKV